VARCRSALSVSAFSVGAAEKQDRVERIRGPSDLTDAQPSPRARSVIVELQGARERIQGQFNALLPLAQGAIKKRASLRQSMISASKTLTFDSDRRLAITRKQRLFNALPECESRDQRASNARAQSATRKKQDGRMLCSCPNLISSPPPGKAATSHYTLDPPL